MPFLGDRSHTYRHCLWIVISTLTVICLSTNIHANSNTAAATSGNSELLIDLLYIEQRIERPPVLSNLVSWPEDEGMQGAALGVNDDNTTGRFSGQLYALNSLVFESDEPEDSTLKSCGCC
jgi:hypothetical protein